jgi:murein L,D-transpeptidase YcbB/YkuD
MKRHFLLLIMLASSINLLAQSYDIKKETQRVNSTKYDGYASVVEGPVDKVEDFWLAYLKENARVRRKRNYYQITEFQTSKYALDSLTLLTRVTDVDSLGQVWIGIEDKLDPGIKSEKVQNLEAVLEKFTRAYYLDAQQKKINESEQAAVYVSKNHAKLITEAEDLRLELNSAEGYKIRLEEQLENTILEIKVLIQKIEDNKMATANTYKDLQQINQVLEQNKADLKKIN